MFKKIKKTNNGAVLLYLLVTITVFSLMLFPMIVNVATQLKLLDGKVNKEQALQIAEAGINYYQWRLAHFPNDYKDGTTNSGPYVHNYTDYDLGGVVGTFSLVITPPLVGSTVVTIKSTGWTSNNPGIKRTITARYGIPSLAKYAFLSNDVIWIGDTETVGGQLQSNNGIRFDGIGNAPIQSAKSTYTCPTTQGNPPCPTTKNGVWGSAPATTQSFWQFPVPAVDFSTLTSDLSIMKSNAQSNGIYLPPSNDEGYSLVFKSNGTIDIYKVTSLKNTPTGTDVNWVAHTENIDYKNTSLQFTKNMPSNGIVYIEDNVWVEGVVHGRVMVAASVLPYVAATAPTIYIPNNIVYTAKDGTDSLGLLSQKDIVITYNAPDDLEIDAALIAQNGAAQMYYYSYGGLKDSITVYGAIMSFGQWTWSWLSGGSITSGYPNTHSNYDGNLLYAPPPSFPVSTSGYQLLSWSSD